MGEEYQYNKYNWDDIDVGHLDLNHSENFFVKKHIKHEKIDDISPEKFVKDMDNKENRNANFNGVRNHPQCEEKLNKNIITTTDTGSKPANLVTEPWQNTGAKKKNTSQTLAAPSLCKYTEIYKRKKQTKMQQQIEEEKKKREFVSKPAPNYAAIHEQQAKRREQNNDVLRCTIPVTPLVLKKSKEVDERKKQKMEEYKKLHQPLNFVSRDAEVLYQEPFIPKKANNNVKLNPFNLHVEKRMEDRKQYDHKYKKKLEEKKLQEQREVKIREEKEIKELRKQTTFKARPNPFK